MSSETDRFLVQQIRQGDTRAWEDMIARYEGRLRAFVYRRLHDHTASEDVVQETFVGFWHSLPNFDDQRDLQTYLFTIASYKLTDHLRRAGRHPLHAASDHPSGVLEGQRDPGPGPTTFERSQERRSLEAEAVCQCLGQMLKQWQERGDHLRVKVLELLLVKGWANRDVAARLEISEQQVANIRFAAVKKLTEQIRDAGLSADVFPELHRPSE
jgi:RNA polymerase sigma-70 factor (ECF subfamily)